MSGLKLKIGQTYYDENNEVIAIDGRTLLSSNNDRYLAYVGWKRTNGQNGPYLYTEKGRGISGLSASMGFTDPADLKEVAIATTDRSGWKRQEVD